MEYRKFGNTGLKVSAVGFGAWGIGGAAMAGDTAIGWGRNADAVAITALNRAFDLGVNFFDTADFYGLGRSETLIGETFGNSPDVIIASKVGHRLAEHGRIFTDYSREHIRNACHKSLFRLRRDAIDFYQLHTARVTDLENGDCIEAMENLVREGKVRHWGISLNTFHPQPEADYMIRRRLGDGFQLVLNILNQRAVALLPGMKEAGYGVIARMPLQFGLLTGKFDAESRFTENDHRHFRLHPALLKAATEALGPVWQLAKKYKTTGTGLALGFALGFPEVSTVIPGIKTPEQATLNTVPAVKLERADRAFLERLFHEKFAPEIMPGLEKAG